MAGNRETPQIGSTMYAAAMSAAMPTLAADYDKLDAGHIDWLQASARRIEQQAKPEIKPEVKEQKMATRLVKVFIVDPEESLALGDRLLYRSEEFVTDSSDAEIYFDLDIRGMLDLHNEKRVATVDRKTKDREKPAMLEPARVRDLKMQVITLAQF